MKEIGGSRYIDRIEYMKYKDALTCDLTQTMFSLGFIGKNNLFLSSGRCVEKYVLDMIEDDKKIAILPAFSCETVILPFLERGYSIRYYHIQKNLKINLELLDNLIEKYNPSVVLYHGIWGFDSCDGIDTIVQKYQGYEIVFIEDRTLDIFRMKNYSDNAQFTIGSFRKLYVVPDGGFLFSSKILDRSKINGYSKELEQAKLNAYLNMYDYRINNIGTFEHCNKLCENAEDILENADSYYEMSPASKKIICSSNLNEIKEKRRSNYTFLYENLSDVKGINIITHKLTSGIVPYHFAISVENKLDLFAYLYKHNIFPSNAWNTFEYVNDIEMNQYEAELYHNCFFLEISDIYDADDMKRMVNVIKEYVYCRNCHFKEIRVLKHS